MKFSIKRFINITLTYRYPKFLIESKFFKNCVTRIAMPKARRSFTFQNIKSEVTSNTN